MLLRVLDDGMSTRLYERICDDKGLCYDVGALYESYEDDGVFDVAAEAQHERVVEVAREIARLLGRAFQPRDPARRSSTGPKRAICGRRRRCSTTPRGLALFTPFRHFRDSRLHPGKGTTSFSK